MRRRGKWTATAAGKLQPVREIIGGLAAYWPLTLRQIFYQLVAAGMIENTRAAYGNLSRLLTRARLDGLVSWEAMEDRSRTRLQSGGWTNAADFVTSETAGFLTGYRRDLLTGQAVRPELWIEKDALSRVAHAAAFPYCVPVIVARGFSSVTFLHDAARRIEANAANGQGTAVLYFGDLDPSGWAMLPAMMETLAELGCGGEVTAERCGLNPEQVETYELPKNPDALKLSDSRAAAYRAQFGDLAVELDALRPDLLADLVRQSIEQVLDMSQFETQREIEAAEIEQLSQTRRSVVAAVEVRS